MIKKILECVFFLVFGLLSLNEVQADTVVSGDISDNTVWTQLDSPYIVVNPISILREAILTIEPGVVVKFEKNSTLSVGGCLVARGTPGNLITFTSNQNVPFPGDWGSISFTDSSVDAFYNQEAHYESGCILQYCLVEYNTGGIRFFSCSPFIDHCIVINNKGGIHAHDCSMKVSHNIVTNISTIESAGISVWSAENNYCEIANNIVADVLGSGISVFRNALVHDNMVLSNTDTGINSIHGYDANPSPGYDRLIFNNIVYNNHSKHPENIQWSGGIIDMGATAIGTPWSGKGIITNNVIFGNILEGDNSGIYGGKAITGNVVAKNNFGTAGFGYLYGFGKSGISSSAEIVTKNLVTFNMANSEFPASCAGMKLQMYTWSIHGDQLVIENTVANNYFVPGTQSGAIYLMDGDVITEVRGNNVFQNTGYQFYYDNIEGNYHDIDATYNYFGTNNDAEIQNGIYDDFDDPLLGVINYSPFRTEPAGFPGGEKPFIIGKIGRPWAIVTSSGKNETWELGSFGFDAKDSQENLTWSVTGADASKFNVYIDDVILILRKAIGLDD